MTHSKITISVVTNKDGNIAIKHSIVGKPDREAVTTLYKLFPMVMSRIKNKLGIKRMTDPDFDMEGEL